DLDIIRKKLSLLHTLGKKEKNIEFLKEALSIAKSLDMDQAIEKIKIDMENVSEKIKFARVSQQRQETDYANSAGNFNQSAKIRNLLTKIYTDFIMMEEIETAEINDWDKSILKIAYYDKKSQKQNAISFIKEMKQKYDEFSDYKKTLNLLLERMKSKRNLVFRAAYYENELGVLVDFNLAKQLEYQKAQEERTSQQINKTPVTPSPTVVPFRIKNLEVSKSAATVPEQKIIVSSGTPVTPRYQQLATANSENTKSVKNVDTSIQKAPDLRIRDVFASEVTEIGSQLCIQMSSDQSHSMTESLDALDRFENLIEKSANDISALNDMINLIDRLNYKSPGFIKTNDKRNDKLLREAKQKQMLKNRIN
ncbi:MAG: hypothetical protein K2I72_02170, partial [Bacilli bacterium]|nr:hypothetical protein [Bacilli bacterium]